MLGKLAKRFDRPLSRSAVKIAARVLLGTARAHWQDGFPSLKIVKSEDPAQVFYRGRAVCTLRPWSVLGSGQASTYVIGSGPSLTGCDMARVEPHSAIILNGAINLMARDIPAPLAVAIEDERFVWRHFTLMRDRIAADTICLFSVQVLRAICEHDAGWLTDKRVVLIDNIAKPYGLPRRNRAELAEIPFAVFDPRTGTGMSRAPGEGVFQGGTVAISAMQFLIACKPKSIGFFGVDISNANLPRFYEAEGKSAYSGIAAAQARILGHFEIGLSLCAQQGTELQCYSPNSALLSAGYPYSDRFSL